MLRLAVISSTNGSVMNAVLASPYMRERLELVISDRECGAISVARSYGIPTVLYPTTNTMDFSNHLANYFSNNEYDLVISFYTKLFRGQVIDLLYGKFVNFHPSILPAFPGVDGFGDSVISGSKFIGATVHLIDSGVDDGYPVLQCAFPSDPDCPIEQRRHIIFVAQCKMLIQLVRWFEQKRICLDACGRPTLKDGKYRLGPFSPNLDFENALGFFPEHDGCGGI